MDSAHCGGRIGIYKKNAEIPPCRNESCRKKQPESEIYFDIRVNISDHTGSMKNFRLANNFATKAFGCTVDIKLKKVPFNQDTIVFFLRRWTSI